MKKVNEFMVQNVKLMVDGEKKLAVVLRDSVLEYDEF
jgi:hypothetical protein